MQAVIRKYSGKGAAELLDLLDQRKSEIEATMRSVPGFVSYTLARSETGGFSVTICQDQAGIDDSTRRARDWIAQNARGISVAAPEVVAGKIVTHSR